MVKKTSRRPEFVNKWTAQTAAITFKRSGATNGDNNSHTLAEIKSLEDLLAFHFRRICLVGDFTIAFNEKLLGTPHTKGLTMVGLQGNSVRVAYHKGGNDTRFAYSIPLPPHLSQNVYERLNDSIKQGFSGTEPKKTIILADKGEKMDSDFAEMATPVPVSNIAERIFEIYVNQGVALLEFATSVPAEMLSSLKIDLTEIMQQRADSGIYKVKAGEAITAAPTNTYERLLWCKLQQNARGIGFWYRPNVKDDFTKFSLIPDEKADLENLADQLGKSAAPAKAVPLFRSAPVISTVNLDDFIDDTELLANFLRAFANRVFKESLVTVPSWMTTELFKSVSNSDLDPRKIGRLMGEWSAKGFLWRKKPSPSAPSYVYGLGLKSREHLPTDYHLLTGTAIRSVHPIQTQHKTIKEVEIVDSTPIDSSERVAPVKKPEIVAAVFAGKPRSGADAVSDALTRLAEKQAQILVAQAQLAEFSEVTQRIAELEAKMKEVHAEIKRQLEVVKNLTAQHEALVARLPPAAEIDLLVNSMLM